MNDHGVSDRTSARKCYKFERMILDFGNFHVVGRCQGKDLQALVHRSTFLSASTPIKSETLTLNEAEPSGTSISHLKTRPTMYNVYISCHHGTFWLLPNFYKSVQTNRKKNFVKLLTPQVFFFADLDWSRISRKW